MITTFRHCQVPDYYVTYILSSFLVNVLKLLVEVPLSLKLEMHFVEFQSSQCVFDRVMCLGLDVPLEEEPI